MRLFGRRDEPDDFAEYLPALPDFPDWDEKWPDPVKQAWLLAWGECFRKLADKL